MAFEKKLLLTWATQRQLWWEWNGQPVALMVKWVCWPWKFFRTERRRIPPRDRAYVQPSEIPGVITYNVLRPSPRRKSIYSYINDSLSVLIAFNSVHDMKVNKNPFPRHVIMGDARCYYTGIYYIANHNTGQKRVVQFLFNKLSVNLLWFTWMITFHNYNQSKFNLIIFFIVLKPQFTDRGVSIWCCKLVISDFDEF